MTLVQLEYLIAVSETLNFTLAAEKSFVTQPTLSMQIQKLENELGVELFDRSTNPVSVTKIGEKVVQQAKVIIYEAGRMKHLVTQEKENMEGVIRVGVIPTLMPTLVPLFYSKFTSAFPKVQLMLEEIVTAKAVEELRDDRLDFVLAATPLDEDDIQEEVLFYEPLLAYIPAGHRLFGRNEIRTSDLKTEEILLLDEGHCFRDQVLSLCDKAGNTGNKVQLSGGQFQTLIKLAEEGIGMTVLPAMHSEDLSEHHQKHLVNFEKPMPMREVSLLYHKNQLQMNFAHAFADLIKGLVRGKIFLKSAGEDQRQLSLTKP
ncbi:MAG: hydrogen peroxide-inducible genes activator [Weeksellaceae bacterium]|nr:hydrogen peroxide-inducible genes activator [Weeksellaceae bacterium]